MTDPTPRQRLTDRLRCIIAAQEWDGPIEVGDAEQIAADLIESAGLAELLGDRIESEADRG